MGVPAIDSGVPPLEHPEDNAAHLIRTDSTESEDNQDHLHESDLHHQREADQIFSAYRSLHSRRVDLVGDYAGKELFLIEGDSILLRCFNDDKLDFNGGFQLLHAAYIVEKLLRHLHQRKCNFRIVFFACNQDLCLPAHIDRTQAPKYLFARAVIIRHLSSLLPKTHREITVHIFESWESQDFRDHLRDESPYFLMLHDGAQLANESHAKGDEPHSSHHIAKQRLYFRRMILSLIADGYNIALINELQWKDTKVMTNVLEVSRRLRMSHIPNFDNVPPNKTTTRDVTEQIAQLTSSGIELNEAQILAVITISIILERSSTASASQEILSHCQHFLLHCAFLVHLPLSARRLSDSSCSKSQQEFIIVVADISTSILAHPSWLNQATSVKVTSNVVDFIDGRLFLFLCQNKITVHTEVQETLKQLQGALAILLHQRSSINPLQQQYLGIFESFAQPSADNDDMAAMTILPFSNSVFDKHLEPVHVKIDASSFTVPSSTSERVFKEVSHWHNAKKPMARKGAARTVDSTHAKRAAIRNQRFMAEMQKYAASLTNAVGKALEPETVVVSGQTQPGKALPESSSGKPLTKQRQDAKAKKLNKAKEARTEQRTADQAQQTAALEQSLHRAWLVVRDDIDLIEKPQTRFLRAQTYLNSLSTEKDKMIGAECEIYSINCLVSYWQQSHKVSQGFQTLHIAALIWHHLLIVSQRRQLSEAGAKFVSQTISVLGLPSVPLNFEVVQKKTANIRLPMSVTKLNSDKSHKQFLLLHCGPYLERSFDSEVDPRVGFQPDAWQRRVLDSIDADRSVFVVAPTSAGKTFISFYAMQKVLRADNEGILVYVAPTKALVNQIAAEIQARFSKTFEHAGRSVWAVHTRDYRINNPTGCQILVTVPHILQIMLMSPANASSWSSRIKRIIFDEVHSIGQADDGVIWEQLLLMAPSPIIALSATVGNPDEFSQWLRSTQNSIGIELDTIIHPYRYSDLRKFYYMPPNDFRFTGLRRSEEIHDLSLDGLEGLVYIHPVVALVDRTRGIPEDLALEPRDCLFLWQAFKKCENSNYAVLDELNPERALPALLRKQDVLLWEASLRQLLRSWLDDLESPFENLVEELGKGFLDQVHQNDIVQSSPASILNLAARESNNIIDETMALLVELHQRDALPAILFNYDRSQCEKICKGLLDALVAAEATQVKSGTKWLKKLEAFENWKRSEELSKSKEAKSSKQKQQKRSDAEEAGGLSKVDAQRESASSSGSKWERFDPNKPEDGYHFADNTKLQLSELEGMLSELRYREINPMFLEALGRGIGVHHAGMNRKYRQVVEILFRRRFLRVVIATGTLALGINMPCKTVVFAGDSIYLTALNYRQCAGRSGRRGFDMLGNVVFQGISKQKVCRLISSRLPDLNGHFPITTTLVLRMFILLHESRNSKYATTAINSILSQPRLYMGGESFKEQTMHHLRFSIEYLRRQQLLSKQGTPINLAGMVSHLYYTENSSFAFHALIREGFFNDLCANIQVNEEVVLLDLMLVMANLFNRIACRRSDIEFREEVVKRSSSMVFLPPMPAEAVRILHEHNVQTQSVFETYVRTFVDQHISYDDSVLPLTGAKFGGRLSSSQFPALPPAVVRSSFVALSGAGDTFASIHDLCSTVRSGVFLEEAVIPYMQIGVARDNVPLNAWLLDFYKHGDVRTLEKDNGIRRSDVWFHLNDFSLVLATIVTSLSNLLSTDLDDQAESMDLQGEMDALWEAQDDVELAARHEVSAKGSMASVHSKQVVPLGRTKVQQKKKAKVLDSWDDDGDTDSDTQSNHDDDSTQIDTESNTVNESTSAAGSEDDFGLRKVAKAFEKLQERFNEKFKAMWA